VSLLVYPPDNHCTDSKSIFFLGSALSNCFINGKPVSLSETGNFAFLVDLVLGENNFEIVIDGSTYHRKIFTTKTNSACPVAYAFPYKAFGQEDIEAVNVLRSVLVKDSSIKIPLAKKPDYSISLKSPYKAVLNLGNIPVDLDWIFYADNSEIIIGDIFHKSELVISFANPVAEIFSSWDNGYLVFKPVYIELENIVCIDPGHGATQTGAVSPKGVLEKDLNLSFALKLSQELKIRGLDSKLTRVDDSALSLEQRVSISKQAKIFLSIHHNALPDSRDPNLERGFSLHYYHEHNRDFCLKLSDHLKKHLELPFAGLYRQNLKVLRDNSLSKAVLLELGYLIHPEESDIISSEEFQKKSAIIIADFLSNYLR
jgi:N-acetylmuramoyl-L-alanine amidase